MRKMLFFFGILSLYEGKEGAHIFPSVWCCNPTREKKQKNISKEEANHHHFKGRREYYHTPFARTRIIIMSFNFGNDGATQFQGGGYGCANCLLYFLPPPVRIRTRDDESVFGNIFEYIFE